MYRLLVKSISDKQERGAPRPQLIIVQFDGFAQELHGDDAVRFFEILHQADIGEEVANLPWRDVK